MRTILSVLAVLFLCSAPRLVPVVAAQPGPPPTIHRVTLQLDADVLTITGTGLGPTLVVMVDGQPVTVLPGATDTQMEVQAPATVVTTPGTYRLTVVDPVRQVGDGFVVATSGASVVTAIDSAPDGPSGGAPTDTAQRDSASAPAPGDRVARAPKTAGVSPSLVEGPSNTAVGLYALASNTSGLGNTAVGAAALGVNTSGYWNTATGYLALRNNADGFGKHGQRPSGALRKHVGL